MGMYKLQKVLDLLPPQPVYFCGAEELTAVSGCSPEGSLLTRLLFSPSHLAYPPYFW